ncbi:MAG: hypothetical protein JXB49_04425 [Bacteroidales bacterium]|nr:hypothetical protein [Bacteroidales bacterium]
MRLNLEYLGHIKARKEHYYYTDKNSIFCLTKNIEEGRGDFYFFHIEEINRIAEQLSKKEIESLFYPKDIIGKLNGFHGNKILKKKSEGKESDYRLTRLSYICYYLAYAGYLNMEKQGNKILFRKTKKMNPWKPLEIK